MERKVPKQVILTLLPWYKKNFIKVKWKDSLSDFFHPTAGVRQGGVLSPFLFAIYIEEILNQLREHGKGCKIGKVYLGCILYADDILLISQSVTCMQLMLNICSHVSKYLDLKFNAKKSACMRIGKRCNVKCSKLLLDGVELPCAEEINYLGITIMKGVKFGRSFCATKIKFYRSFNAIYSKASFACEDVLINLFRAYCLPIITYACEAVVPSRTDGRSLDKLVCLAFNKNFHTFDNGVIDNVRCEFGLANIMEILERRQRKFMDHYYKKEFTFCDTIFGINCGNILS